MVILNMLKKITPLLMLFLVGCATQKTAFVPAGASVEKGSVVYVYRAGKVSNLMIPPEVSIHNDQEDKINIGRLSYGEYKLVYLKPGQYKIQIDEIKYYAPGKELTIEVKPDTVNYLQLSSSLKFETGVHYKAYERKFSVQEVEQAIALNELAGSVDVDKKPKKKDRSVKAESGVVKKDALENDEAAVFSTDKTSDPFSRNR